MSSMDQYERSQLADAVSTLEFGAGEAVINKGEVGDRFYMLESGTAR